MHTHTLDMTAGSPVRLLLRFSLPLFIGNLLQQIYNLSDTAIAGHLLGDAALSQIGATAALYRLITTLAFGLNSGFARRGRQRANGAIRSLDDNTLNALRRRDNHLFSARSLCVGRRNADSRRHPRRRFDVSDRDSGGHSADDGV